MVDKKKYEKPRLCDLSGRDIREGYGQGTTGVKCGSGAMASANCNVGGLASGGKCAAGTTPQGQCQTGGSASWKCTPGARIRPS